MGTGWIPSRPWTMSLLKKITGRLSLSLLDVDLFLIQTRSTAMLTAHKRELLEVPIMLELVERSLETPIIPSKILQACILAIPPPSYSGPESRAASHQAHSLLDGDYGCGKTSLEISSALREAEIGGGEVVYITGTSYQEKGKHTQEVEYLLDIATKEKFIQSSVTCLSLSDIRKMFNLPLDSSFETIIQKFMQNKDKMTTKVYIDELPVSEDDLEKMSKNEESDLSKTLAHISTNCCKSLIALRTGDLNEMKSTGGKKTSLSGSAMLQYLEQRTGYKAAQLHLTMRTSANIRQACPQNIGEYTAATVFTAVSVVPGGVSPPSTVPGMRPICLLSPWAITADYDKIEKSLAKALKTILKIPNPVTQQIVIICGCYISPLTVGSIVGQYYPVVAVYDGGVKEYDYKESATYHSHNPAQQRADAVTWLRHGGIMITHGSLFAGMECGTVVLVTRDMGYSGQARSNLMRAVSRLVVVTDSDHVKQDGLEKHFTVQNI